MRLAHVSICLKDGKDDTIAIVQLLGKIKVDSLEIVGIKFLSCGGLRHLMPSDAVVFKSLGLLKVHCCSLSEGLG